MIKVALVGVGNCASSLVQGVAYYTLNPDASGLIIKDVCGFSASDLEFVAAFDVDQDKVGKPLNEAIFAGKNNTTKLVDAMAGASCRVNAAPVLDGIGTVYKDVVNVVDGAVDAVNKILSSTQPDVLVNYLPVGSDGASQFWAEMCLTHNIGFVNAIPSFIVSNADWAQRFSEAGVPCAGDDVKSQIGATIIHRALARLFEQRGGEVDTTYQLNFGGNMDFRNMLETERLHSKKKSKASSVQHEIPAVADSQVHISPTDYIEFLGDQKIAYINLSGTAFGGTPLEIECKIKVSDSPNSAGVVMDVVRFVAAAKKRGQGGPVDITPFYFKSPPQNIADDEAEKIALEIASNSVF